MAVSELLAVTVNSVLSDRSLVAVSVVATRHGAASRKESTKITTLIIIFSITPFYGSITFITEYDSSRFGFGHFILC